MNSPFAWPGGKSGLLKDLQARMPAHSIYVEVFAGSAKLLFAKQPSDGEVMNDLNGEVVNFFRVVKHRPAELAELLEQEIVHPQRFRDLLNDSSVDELSRALRFAYTTWYSYGAKGQHFAAANLRETQKGHIRRPLNTIRELLTLTADRLRRVRIEQRDYADLITRFDTTETFFYLDPPYVHFQPLARYDALPVERRVELFDLLTNIQGKFLMSFDDCSEVRELAERYSMVVEEVETRYGLGNTPGSRRRVKELLISG